MTLETIGVGFGTAGLGDRGFKVRHNKI